MPNTSTSLPETLFMAQEFTNWQESDIQVPYWLSIYRSSYGRAAMELNWRPLWLGEGAIAGIVEEVEIHC